MNLSVSDISLASAEAKALAELAAQSKEALVRALKSLSGSKLIVAEVSRLYPDSEPLVPPDNSQPRVEQQPGDTTKRQDPVILKLPEGNIIVASQQQADLQALVGEQVVVKVTAVEPRIKLEIVDTLANYIAKQAESSPVAETDNNVQLPTGSDSSSYSNNNDANVNTQPPVNILLNVIAQTQIPQGQPGNAEATGQVLINTSASNATPTISLGSSNLSSRGDQPDSRELQGTDDNDVLLPGRDDLVNSKQVTDDTLVEALFNQVGTKPVSDSNPGTEAVIRGVITTSPNAKATDVIAGVVDSDIPMEPPALLKPQLLQTGGQTRTANTDSKQSAELQQTTTNNTGAALPEFRLNTSGNLQTSDDAQQPVTPLNLTNQPVSLETTKPELENGVNNRAQADKDLKPVVTSPSTPPETSPTSVAWYTSDTIRDLIEPIIVKPINLPDRQQFTLLNQSVVGASQRLTTGRETTMGATLNTLTQQLQRLQEWSAANKRYLRSEQGQVLNKAATDSIGGLKELRRYTPETNKLSTEQSVARAIKRSGIFAEQKRLPEASMQNTQQRPTLHTDTKVNLQRIITATLYHLGKLSSMATTADIPTTATGPVQSSLLTTKAKGSVPNDLVRMIKDRLNAYGESRLPAELPQQLQRLLQQVLNQSNQALQRTEIQQLSNLRSDSQSPQWFFELPIWNGKEMDNLQLMMRREANTIDREIKQSWSLMLQFDMQKLGKVRAVVKWYDGDTSLLFLANKPETVSLLQAELTTMRERVGQKNINLQDLDVQLSELQDIRFEMKRAES